MYKIESTESIRKKTESGSHLFEVVSLFAGGGGSSTGYRMAGGKVLAISEFIPAAQETYKANWPTTKIFKKDIRETSPVEILHAIGKAKGDLDLLDGSPPCSAFSTAGAREKGWGKVKKYSDAQQENVEDLFFEYIRILRGLMPKVFVAENVAGLVKGKAKGYFNQILRELRASGYCVEAKILDAKWLGIPQSRPRLIFVGVRNDLFKSEMKGALHPKPHKKIVTLEEAFEGLEFTSSDKISTSLERFKVYSLLKPMTAGTSHDKAFTLHKNSPKSVSAAIKAATSRISAREVYHWDNRAHTVAEIKRIMSIPDDYILTGNYQQQVERLGRMVPPLMMKQVAETIAKTGVFKNENTE